jgi:hypothetical protein
MTLLSFADCCLGLGVDPKTLRLWLKAANLSCCLHPSDARLKCLTPSQLQHLADLHGRCLPHLLPGTGEDATSCSLVSPPCSQTPSAAGSEALMPSADSDLRHQFMLLQAQVATLQGHVTELALALVREREARGQEHTTQIKTSLSSSSAQLTSPPQADADALSPLLPFQFHQWWPPSALLLLLARSRSSNTGLREPMESFLLWKASLLWFPTPHTGLSGWLRFRLSAS